VFERFHDDARQAVMLAQDEGRRLGATHIGPEHLLLGLLRLDDGPAWRALRDAGVDAAATRERVAARSGGLDPDALASIGIDLEEVRRATEAAFGEGALDGPRTRTGRIPFAAESKKALELSLRHSLRLGHKGIDSGHVLLGILHVNDPTVTHVLHEAGTDPAQLARLIDQAA
jgi:ATP-dependent Clp protease ATP-binding subunit ClpA